jgi:hypothetical protein
MTSLREQMIARGLITEAARVAPLPPAAPRVASPPAKNLHPGKQEKKKPRPVSKISPALPLAAHLYLDESGSFTKEESRFVAGLAVPAGGEDLPRRLLQAARRDASRRGRCPRGRCTMAKAWCRSTTRSLAW